MFSIAVVGVPFLWHTRVGTIGQNDNLPPYLAMMGAGEDLHFHLASPTITRNGMVEYHPVETQAPAQQAPVPAPGGQGAAQAGVAPRRDQAWCPWSRP